MVNEFVYDLYLPVNKALQRIVVEVVNDPERDRKYKYRYVPHLVQEQAKQCIRRADDERGDERKPPWGKVFCIEYRHFVKLKVKS